MAPWRRAFLTQTQEAPYLRARPLTPKEEAEGARLARQDAVQWDGGRLDAWLQESRPRSRAFDVLLAPGGAAAATLRFWWAAGSMAEGEVAAAAAWAARLLQWASVALGGQALQPPRLSANVWLQPAPARAVGPRSWPGRPEVNGGWTVLGEGVVHVHRREEWDRVLLHEALHALGGDWDPSLFKGAAPPAAGHLGEAWTEASAEWLWCAAHGVPWHVQRAWARAQAAAILQRAPRPWREDTSVFSYYCLKDALAERMGAILARGTRLPPAPPFDIPAAWRSHVGSLALEVPLATPDETLPLRMTPALR